MKTQKCTQGWRNYLTSSSLLIVFIGVLFILRTIFGIQRNSEELSDFIQKKVVVVINDQVVIDKKNIKTDTLNIYLNNFKTKTIEVVDTVKVDTIVLDTLNK